MTAQEFKDIFLPYYKTLYRVAYHLTGGAADAEDLLQDLYLKLWKQRDMFPSEARCEAYLVRMMQNLYYDEVRRKRFDTSAELIDVQPPDSDNLELKIETDEQMQLLLKLIEELPPKERLVATLFIIDRKSYSEIQKETQLQADNIRQLLHRAKTKLTNQLNNINNHEGHKS